MRTPAIDTLNTVHTCSRSEWFIETCWVARIRKLYAHFAYVIPRTCHLDGHTICRVLYVRRRTSIYAFTCWRFLYVRAEETLHSYSNTHNSPTPPPPQSPPAPPRFLDTWHHTETTFTLCCVCVCLWITFGMSHRRCRRRRRRHRSRIHRRRCHRQRHQSSVSCHQQTVCVSVVRTYLSAHCHCNILLYISTWVAFCALAHVPKTTNISHAHRRSASPLCRRMCVLCMICLRNKQDKCASFIEYGTQYRRFRNVAANLKIKRVVTVLEIKTLQLVFVAETPQFEINSNAITTTFGTSCTCETSS